MSWWHQTYTLVRNEDGIDKTLPLFNPALSLHSPLTLQNQSAWFLRLLNLLQIQEFLFFSSPPQTWGFHSTLWPNILMLSSASLLSFSLPLLSLLPFSSLPWLFTFFSCFAHQWARSPIRLLTRCCNIVGWALQASQGTWISQYDKSSGIDSLNLWSLIQPQTSWNSDWSLCVACSCPASRLLRIRSLASFTVHQSGYCTLKIHVCIEFWYHRFCMYFEFHRKFFWCYRISHFVGI